MIAMFQFENLVRDNIKTLVPYSSARSDFTKAADIFIDANENPYQTEYNRYPDPLQQRLKEKIAELKNINAQRIFLGNGSDEIIDLLMRCICEPGRDNIITFSPSYTMYRTTAQINDLEIRSIDLNADFSIDLKKIKEQSDLHSKILFLCSPNNPVGTMIPHSVIEECCKQFKGIVVVDEAYIDFASTPSSIGLLDKHPNLLILQTLSKAYAMAGLRVGMCFASEEIIAVLNKVKPPYNISSLSQNKALASLNDDTKYKEQLAILLAERERLYAAFSKMNLFEKVYPSEANFILTISKDFKEIYNYLAEHKVIARLRDIPPLIAGGLRFSVGTPEENTRVIELLNKYAKSKQ